MKYTLSQSIGYHAGRAMEELERAEATDIEMARGRHMELSRLHLNTAGKFRVIETIGSLRVAQRSKVLDMGKASREEGFRLFGCR